MDYGLHKLLQGDVIPPSGQAVQDAASGQASGRSAEPGHLQVRYPAINLQQIAHAAGESLKQLGSVEDAD